MRLDGDEPRHDWCKLLGLLSVYAAEAEDVLGEAVYAVLANRDRAAPPTVDGRAAASPWPWTART